MLTILYVTAICFGAIILPSSGSWYQNLFKTYHNKISHDKHTYRPFATTMSQPYTSPICHNNVTTVYIAHLPQQCHNSKFVIFQEKYSKVLKCYNFLWVQRRHNCSPAASFASCVMTLYLLQVHLQTFLSIPTTQKRQILYCWHSCRKWALCCDINICLFVCLFSWRYNPLCLHFHSPVAGFSLLVFARFLDHTQRRAIVGKTPLDEWSARRRDLYLTTHNTHNR
jgi:hypothetical protein